MSIKVLFTQCSLYRASIKLLSASWTNSMYILIQSRHIPTFFGGANHHHQGRQHHRPKTLLLDCVHLVRRTLLYFASLFNTELFMSYEYFSMCDIDSSVLVTLPTYNVWYKRLFWKRARNIAMCALHSNSSICWSMVLSFRMMVVGITESCWYIAWLYKYIRMHSVGPTCRQ